MKRTFNQFEKSDMPLDSSIPNSFKSSTPQKIKSGLSVIGKKKFSEQKPEKLNKRPNVEESLRRIEQINEDSLKKTIFNRRRNQVVIISLIVLLLIAIGAILAFSFLYEKRYSCNVIFTGEIKAKCYIDGENKTTFKAPSNLEDSRVFAMDIDLEIKEEGRYKVSFKFKCNKAGKELTPVYPYQANLNLFAWNNVEQRYESVSSIEGKKRIDLCQGCNLSAVYDAGLSNSTFTMELIITIEAV